MLLITHHDLVLLDRVRSGLLVLVPVPVRAQVQLELELELELELAVEREQEGNQRRVEDCLPQEAPAPTVTASNDKRVCSPTPSLRT